MIPDSFKERRAGIRGIVVPDIGAVLRRQYASGSPSPVWEVVRDELPRLAAVEAMRTDLEV